MSPLLAARAYAAAQGVAPQTGAAAAKIAGGDGPDFAQVLSRTVGDMVQTSHTAERAMAAHTAGKAELVDVVTAVASAQSSLETVMAVRDQVISAYQEILRMPI